MTLVTVLECHHSTDIDPNPLSDLYASMGTSRAEQVICDALEDLANRLNALQSTWIGSSFDDVTRQAIRMAGIAGGIGLTEVSTAARHVGDAAWQRDGIALEATLARLERGFDAAIGQIWSLRQG